MVKSKNQVDYIEYKTAKTNAKKIIKTAKYIIKTAKINSWKEYGDMLNADYKNAQKRFYKKIKNMTKKEDIYMNQQK